MPVTVIVAATAAFVEGALIAASWTTLAAAIGGALAAAGVAMLIGSALGKSGDSSAFGDSLRSITATARDPIAPRRVVYGKTRLGGIITFMSASSNKRYLHMVITLTGHPIEEFTTIYINDEAATLDGNGFVTTPTQYANPAVGIASSIRIKTDDGTATGQPFSDLVAEVSEWTDAHRQTGCAKLYVRLEYYQDDFPNGVPNITALIKGKKVYDPRSALTAYSANAALCVSDYLTDAVNGVGATYATEIDETALTTAANICDESVNLDAGGTEKRYEANGVYVVDSTPETVLPQLLSAMAGRVTYTAGKWRILAGAYVTPTLTLTQSDLVGPIGISSLLSKRDVFNSVRGQFADPAKLYQPSDYPPLSVAAYIAKDGNEVLWSELNLPFTTSYTMAQRIARIELRRTRNQIRVSLLCNLGAYRLQPGDTFYLTLDKYGWSQKVFEVSELTFAFDPNGALAVSILAAETSSTVYDWATTDEQAMAANPATNLPDPFTVAAPGAPSITEELYQTILSSGVKTLARATWSVPDDYFAQSGLAKYRFEFKKTSTSSWTSVSDTAEATMVLYDLEPDTYDFRVKAYSVGGVQSAYSGTTTKQIVGLTDPPTIVRSFSVHPIAGQAAMSWALHDDLDVRIGGKIEVRHSLSNSAYQWQDSALVALFDGLATTGIGPLVEGTYLCKARDSSQIYSNSVAVFYVLEGLITGYTTVASFAEHTTFVGTKVNLQVTAGVLELTNPASSQTGTYFFPGSIAAYPTYVDLGSKAVRRFESDLQVTRYDTGDLIDSRDAVDTWASVDGGSTDEGEAAMFVRTTDDNPSGSPVWSNWTLFRVAELNCRAAQFKLEYDSEQSTYNVGVTTLAMQVKVPT